MLIRIAARSLRVQPTLLRATIRPHQLRSFAENNKPKNTGDYQVPSSTQSAKLNESTAQRTDQVLGVGGANAVNAASRSSDNSGNSDLSTAQDEFRTNANAEANTTPTNSPGPGAPAPKSTDTSSHSEYSTLQDEFQTTSTSDQNTTPQDTSPSAIDPALTQKPQESVPPPLHDLTKGIPSTLDAELSNASSTSGAEPSDLGIAKNEPRISAGGRGRGQLPASAYITSAERRRNRLMNWMFGGILVFCLTGPIYLGRNWETEEEERKHPDTPSGWGLGLFFNRARARIADTLDYYNEPAFPKLLPDPDPAFERPYTLVLSLEDLLVHSEWTREHGWRMAKRPGVDYFLRYLSQYYELVLFTSVQSMIADPVIRKLDPFRIIVWPLFREATLYKKGEYIKDLSYLNRPLSKTILIDTVPSHAKLQPENAIILPKWKGNPNDNGLVSLIPFLEYVATMNTEDTRKVLASFAGKHIPTEFAAREARARERFEAERAAEIAKRPRRVGIGMLGNAFGIKPMTVMEGGEPSLSEGFEQGKMLMDQIRERGQKVYEAMDKQIRENGEEWLKEAAAEEEKMKEEQMKGMKAGLTGWFGRGGKEKDKEKGEVKSV